MEEYYEPAISSVPRASKPTLFDEVARMNVPFVDAVRETHPIATLLADMKQNQPAVLERGSRLGSCLNQGLGGTGESPILEKSTFDNSFIVAYGLMKVGYVQAGVSLPQVPLLELPDGTYDQVFADINQRQRQLADEYPDFLEAAQTWAAQRIPEYGTGYTVGAVATAAAEMYELFKNAEDVAALERMMGYE